MLQYSGRGLDFSCNSFLAKLKSDLKSLIDRATFKENSAFLTNTILRKKKEKRNQMVDEILALMVKLK